MSVEIIGRSVRAPGADSPETLFELLRQRRCMITRVPADRWDQARYWHPETGVRGKTYTFAAGIIEDAFGFDPALFGISQREAQLMDPQQRLILQLTWRALESASIDYLDLRKQRVGVYVGASALDHGNLIVEDPAAAGPHFMTGNTLSIVSNRISHAFGLNGPSLTVDTACSSSLVALDLAVKALEDGEVDTAIVGGVNVLTHPLAFVGFAQARMLSPEGLCRAYDNDGMGYVRAEGGAVIILRKTEHAQQDRSFARILVSAVNSAGRTNGISLPSEKAQAQLLRSIYSREGIDANRLAFVEGHGTGTKVGDPSEIWSIGTVIGQARRAPIPIGSIKTNIGHTEPASGLLGLLKAVSALENNYFPASLHFETPNESVDFNALNVHVAAEPIELLHGKHPRLAGVNSFGFGGTNAHVIISDPQNPRERDKPEASGKVFMASAHSASALESLIAGYRDTLAKARPADRKAIIAASGANPHLLRHRFVIADDSVEAIVKSIEARTRKKDLPPAIQAEALQDDAKIAYVFSGNGSQWAGMAVDAYRRNTAFRDRFNVIHALFQVRSQISLIDLLLDPELETKLADTKIAQPLLFATQAALADVLALLGVTPHAVYGHSVGEVAAAYVSGAISLVDAVSIVAKRSFHQDRLAGRGKMAALQIGPDEARALFERVGVTGLTVAAVNAKGSVTVSGPSEQIMALKDSLKANRVVGAVLDINYPFHHPSIEVAKEAFLEDMGQIALRQSQVPFISTVTGGVLDGDRLDPAYWWSNVREPVEFHRGTQAAIDLGCTLFVEIGPKPILLNYVRDTIKEHSVAAGCIASLLRDDKAEASPAAADPVSQTYARILAHGGTFDRRKAFGDRNPRIATPPVPFENVDLRHEFTSDAIDLYGRLHVPHTLAGWRVDPISGSWKNHVDAHVLPDLAEHVVDRKSILPGSAFLEIAISAGRQFLGSDTIEISNLEILQPLELGTSGLREISTTVSADTGDIEIRSRGRLSDDDWTIHAVARCRRSPPAMPAAIPSRLKRTGARTILAAAAYETAQNFGLDYGPTFRLLKSAVQTGTNTIDVELHAPAAPANPYLTYALHPISVDAAFHGLVAAFGTLSGATRGAPYIPVRFGAVRLHAAGQQVARAIIEIQRASENSIQVAFTLLGSGGTVIATLGDCRFRRTFLRPQKALADASFHQVAVPTANPALQAARPACGEWAFPAIPDGGPDSSTQMLQAAVYRACHDVAMRASRTTGVVSIDELPGDVAFRRFLASCLYHLEDVNLARNEDGRWVLEADSSLPPSDAILSALTRDRPQRIGEITAVNHVRGEAIRTLDALFAQGATGDEARATAAPPNDATVDSIRVHGPGTLARVELAAAGLASALAAGRARHVVEIGSVSRSTSARFARMAADRGARFTIVEPETAAFGELSIAFEALAHVEVVPPAKVGGIGAADVIVSAADHVFSILEHEAPAAPLLGGLVGPATRIAICAPAPAEFSDFAFGLTPDWFARSTDTEFPVGGFASAAEWRTRLRGLPLRTTRVEQCDLASGPIVLVQASAGMDAPSGAADQLQFQTLAILAADTPDAPSTDGALRLTGDPQADRDALDAALSARTGPACAVAYVPGCLDASDGCDSLVRSVADLSVIAASMQAASGPTRLGVLLHAGDPGHGDEAAEAKPSSEAAATGLWTFVRVLRNEFESLDIHAFDLSGRPRRDLAESLRVTTEIMALPGANREWSFDAATGEPMEMRVVPGPLPPSVAGTTAFTAATVRQAAASQVMSLGWQACETPAPQPGEICIEVAAAGLNFRDVMWAMGVLPEEALEDGFAGPTIGMECAGTVVALGDGVTDFSIGDRVMAVAASAFSTHVCVKTGGAATLPDGVDLAAGATLPVAFLTAYYALVELARLRDGETVLIHGGAGGVGIAALQIAKARGATVIATAGSVEKRRLLEMLGADHVFNSRTLEFAEDVLAVTARQGVDVVLNSLFSEAMERSLGLLKPFGRFLELGKRDFYGDTKIGLRPFRRNVSYFGIDADQLLNVMPDLSARLLSEISGLFAAGTLSPLPYRAFRADEITGAFRLMQGSGHVGKIVVLPPVPGVDAVSAAPRRDFRVDPEGVHLVVGGVGGFGLAAARWLVEHGARKVALATRRGKADEETTAAIARWAGLGVEAIVHGCDVTDEDSVDALLAALRRRGPIRTIVHAAMVLDDALIPNLTPERIRAVVEPKARGAALLDRLSRQDRLDDFILFSSATTLVGNPGQANYVAANGYLEGLARARRRAGLPALAVGFGAISDTGFLARNTEVNELLSKRIGKTAMTATQALGLVADHIERDPGTVEAAVVAIAEIDMSMARHLRTVATPLFEIAARSARAQNSSGDSDQLDLVAMVEGKSPEEGEQLIFQLVAGEIASILRIPVGDVTATKVIKDVGLDSLMAMELGMSFRQKTGFEMPLSSITQSTTVGDVAQKLYQKVTQRADSEPETADHASHASVVDHLAQRHTNPDRTAAQ
ncbi:MAG: SDR family NAD(P)-dependent oxidoreductase [Rhizobiaceae bacterium]|nr:SDR family NAD(P)-dependent oxidoreductase [Rhizobiaceae bacterium]